MSRFIGGRIGPPINNPAGTAPSGSFSIDDQYHLTSLNRWVPKGTQQFPLTSISEAPDLAGVYWIQPSGVSTAFQTYIDNSFGGPWALTWVVTNNNGDTADWFAGDVLGTGTNHFTNISTFGTTTSPTAKSNAKNPLFDYVAFQDMMIVENYSGTLGTKKYRLSSTSSFRSRFVNATGYNAVSSIIQSTGSFRTFNTNDLMFNYVLNNDGARLAATVASNEAVGGISARVDGGSSYAWDGNLTRSDSSRNFDQDGTTTDHTVWIYIK